MTARFGLRLRFVLICTMLAVGLGGILILFGPGDPYVSRHWLWLLVVAATTALVSALVARSLIDPIAHLIYAAHRWAGGDFTYRAMIRSGDEMQVLADALNHMVASIQHRDESIRLDADERLHQADRLATVGRLAAGVAHEISDPLGRILLYADLVLESIPAEDPMRPNLEKIIAEAARAQEIVRGFLDLTRQTPPSVERVDFNRLIREVLDLLEGQLQIQNVVLQTELCGIPLWVKVDARKMQQAFINIVMNALDAMPNAGTLTVSSGFSERNGFCRVAVMDTGVGIAEEDLHRIFEPFFTTKGAGKRLGLGLSITHGIVQQQGGDVEVQSAPGQGTTIRILLPVEMAIDVEALEA